MRTKIVQSKSINWALFVVPLVGVIVGLLVWMLGYSGLKEQEMADLEAKIAELEASIVDSESQAIAQAQAKDARIAELESRIAELSADVASHEEFRATLQVEASVLDTASPDSLGAIIVYLMEEVGRLQCLLDPQREGCS